MMTFEQCVRRTVKCPGDIVVTLHNFLVKYSAEDKRNNPLLRDYRVARRRYHVSGERHARELCDAAIREKLCQCARYVGPRDGRMHEVTRGRRAWKHPLAGA